MHVVLSQVLSASVHTDGAAAPYDSTETASGVRRGGREPPEELSGVPMKAAVVEKKRGKKLSMAEKVLSRCEALADNRPKVAEFQRYRAGLLSACQGRVHVLQIPAVS